MRTLPQNACGEKTRRHRLVGGVRLASKPGTAESGKCGWPLVKDGLRVRAQLHAPFLHKRRSARKARRRVRHEEPRPAAAPLTADLERHQPFHSAGRRGAHGLEQRTGGDQRVSASAIRRVRSMRRERGAFTLTRRPSRRRFAWCRRPACYRKLRLPYAAGCRGLPGAPDVETLAF